MKNEDILIQLRYSNQIKKVETNSGTQEVVTVRRCFKNLKLTEKITVPLSELPCRPGETFFAIISNEVCELVFKYLSESAYNNSTINIICTIKGKDWDLRCVNYKKNAFKTFEEAQVALNKKLAS